jgi:phosphocarrier protein HPr
VTESELELVNRLGLHARAAAKLVQTAGGYTARVTLHRDGESVDAKSILGILLLAAPVGSRLLVRCEGPDEIAALEGVRTLFAERFGEEE